MGSLSKTVDPVEVPESVEETVSLEGEEVEPVGKSVVEVEKETAPQETTLEPEVVSNETPNSQERSLSVAEAKFLEETSLIQQIEEEVKEEYVPALVAHD